MPGLLPSGLVALAMVSIRLSASKSAMAESCTPSMGGVRTSLNTNMYAAWLGADGGRGGPGGDKTARDGCVGGDDSVGSGCAGLSAGSFGGLGGSTGGSGGGGASK